MVATQGRSFWILDDLSPLRQLAAGDTAVAPRLFGPRPAVAWVDGSGGRARGAVGQNPPFGALIHYLLPAGFGTAEGEEKPPEVSLEILDADGAVLRSLSNAKPERQAPSLWRRLFPEMIEPVLLDARPGANRYLWNLRLEDPDLVEGTTLWGRIAGPTVPPGRYQARLSVGEWSETVDVEVVPDPRLEVPAGAADERFDLARSIWEALNRNHQLIRRLRSVREQVRELADRVGGEAVEASAKQLEEALGTIESRLAQPKIESSQDVLNYTPQLDNQLVDLQSTVESALGRPTAASRERFAELEAELNGIETELEEVLATKLPAFETLLEEVGAPRVVVTTAQVAPRDAGD